MKSDLVTPISLWPNDIIKDKNYPESEVFEFNISPFGSSQIQQEVQTYQFENCHFVHAVFNSKANIKVQVITLIFNSCYIKHFEIGDLYESNVSVVFNGCVVSGDINNTKIKSVEIVNCILNRPFYLSNMQELEISDKKESTSAFWQDKLFVDNGYWHYKEPSDRKQIFVIENVKEILIFAGHDPEKSALSEYSVQIGYDRNITNYKTRISNGHLARLGLTGRATGKITVEDTQIQQLYLSEFTPVGEAVFYSIAPCKQRSEKAKIGIHNCNLDNAWFDNVYFEQYDDVSFFRTRFSNTVFSSCTFPRDYRGFSKFTPLPSDYSSTKQPENPPKDLYEIFLQLKKSLENTGNYYEAQKMQGIAHDALKDIKDISAKDKWILRVNSWSNDHGLSISKPFFKFLGFSIGMYILYLVTLGRVFNSGSVDWNLFGYYFSFIDITHRSDFLVDKADLGGWSIFVDAIGKIITGFFIYQFIAAFRKYGKK